MNKSARYFFIFCLGCLPQNLCAQSLLPQEVTTQLVKSGSVCSCSQICDEVSYVGSKVIPALASFSPAEVSAIKELIPLATPTPTPNIVQPIGDLQIKAVAVAVPAVAEKQPTQSEKIMGFLDELKGFKQCYETDFFSPGEAKAFIGTEFCQRITNTPGYGAQFVKNYLDLLKLYLSGAYSNEEWKSKLRELVAIYKNQYANCGQLALLLAAKVAQLDLKTYQCHAMNGEDHGFVIAIGEDGKPYLIDAYPSVHAYFEIVLVDGNGNATSNPDGAFFTFPDGKIPGKPWSNQDVSPPTPMKCNLIFDPKAKKAV